MEGLARKLMLYKGYIFFSWAGLGYFGVVFYSRRVRHLKKPLNFRGFFVTTDIAYLPKHRAALPEQ